MLGLVLAVGIVIDDAVVVLENIFRHIEEKGDDRRCRRRRAARPRSRSRSWRPRSRWSSSSCPVAFMEGRVGRFFHSFGITVAVAIMVSLFVSFTLTPMLSRALAAPREAGDARRGRAALPRRSSAATAALLALVARATAGRSSCVALAIVADDGAALRHGRQDVPPAGRPERVRGRRSATPGGFTLAETDAACSPRSRAACASSAACADVLTHHRRPDAAACSAGEGDVTDGLDLRAPRRPRRARLLAVRRHGRRARQILHRVPRPAHERAGREPARGGRAAPRRASSSTCAGPDLARLQELRRPADGGHARAARARRRRHHARGAHARAPPR